MMKILICVVKILIDTHTQKLSFKGSLRKRATAIIHHTYTAQGGRMAAVYPAVTGWESGYTLYGLSVYCRAAHTHCAVKSNGTYKCCALLLFLGPACALNVFGRNTQRWISVLKWLSKKLKNNKNNYPCTRQAENIWSHSLYYSMIPDNHLISGRLRAGSTGSLKL